MDITNTTISNVIYKHNDLTMNCSRCGSICGGQEHCETVNSSRNKLIDCHCIHCNSNNKQHGNTKRNLMIYPWVICANTISFLLVNP